MKSAGGEAVLAQAQARDEVDWLAEKHFQYFSQLASAAADHLRKADAGEWLRKLDLSVDDLHAALDRAIAEGRPEALSMAVDLVFFWELRWMPSEGALRLARALEVDRIAPSMRARGLAGLSRMKRATGDEEGARRTVEEALQLARSTGDQIAQLHSLTVLGNTLLHDPALVLDLHPEALQIAHQLGDEALIATVIAGEGVTLQRAGDVQKSRAKLEESLALARRVGAKKTVVEILDHLAGLLSLTDPLDLALELNEEQHQLSEELGHRDAQTGSTIRRANMLLDAARPHEALEFAKKAVTLGHQSPNPRLLVISLGAAAVALADLNDFSEARLYADRAVDIARRDGSPNTSDAFFLSFWLALAEGRLDDAIDAANEGAEIARIHDDELLLSSFRALHGTALAEAGRFVEARAAMAEARRVQEAHGKNLDWSLWPLRDARLLRLEGRLDEAEEMYLEAEKRKVPPDVGEALIGVSQIRRAKSDPDGAGEAILRGLNVLVSFGWRRLALAGLEEGATVLQAMGRDAAAVEVLAWAEALRAQTGSVVYPKDLPNLEKLQEMLGVTANSLPVISMTGVLETDLERAVAALRQGLEG